MRRTHIAVALTGLSLCVAVCAHADVWSSDPLRVPYDLALVSALDAREDVLAADESAAQEEDGDGRDAAKMFAFSLAVPGAGQLVQGQKRGYLYLLAEVALWGGFYYLDSKGLDERDDYERYAEANFRYEDYMEFYEATCVECEPGQEPPGYGDGCRPMAEYGSQEYYEDIGKYDVYWPWWADGAQPNDITPEAQALRDDYWDMRKESNLHLRRARQLVMVALLNHVVSAFDSFLSARGSGPAGDSRLGLEFEVPDSGDGLSCKAYARF